MLKFEVKKRDGTLEYVSIKHLTPGELRRIVGIIKEMDRATELMVGKPKGWADTLAPGAATEIGKQFGNSLLQRDYHG